MKPPELLIRLLMIPIMQYVLSSQWVNRPGWQASQLEVACYQGVLFLHALTHGDFALTGKPDITLPG